MSDLGSRDDTAKPEDQTRNGYQACDLCDSLTRARESLDILDEAVMTWYQRNRINRAEPNCEAYRSLGRLLPDE